MLCVYMPLLHLYVFPVLIIYPYPRFTHSSTSNYIIFVSTSRLKAFEDFEFDFVIASTKFDSPLIYFTFTISLHLYACQKHIISITLGKKKLANDFSLKRTCHWHLLGAISSRLAVNWQVGQLII
jgi:hypothetical protein